MPYGGGYYSSMPYSTPNTGGYYNRPGEMVPAGTEQRQGTRAPTAPPQPSNTQRTQPRGGKEEESTPPDQVRGPAPALILVTLPENAVLQFDGVATRAHSASRLFSSPPLEPGQDYYYTLTAGITRDGQPLTVTQRVIVRAGQTARVNLSFARADTTASR